MTDRDMYLTSNVGNVHIYTPIGDVLTTTSTGSVVMRGGPMHLASLVLHEFSLVGKR